jgi:uncharacterized protein (DUF1015 family)
MAKIIPFKGIYYNPEKVIGDDVIAPPYDVITPEQKELLYEKSPYNIIRIDFGKEMPGDDEKENKYVRAKRFLEQWLQQKILIRDEKESVYAYESEYFVYGVKKSFRGIIALVKLEELGRGIYPHEATHSKPKTDRLNLMRACKANISPIYSLYKSEERITSKIISDIKKDPLISAHDFDGAVHRIYRISDDLAINSILKELSDKPIFIADGHHRYEVALEYKREMGEGPWSYVMMFLANMLDEGITILPTHRMIKGIKKEEVLSRLENDFDIESCGIDCDIRKRLFLEGKNTFGLYLGNNEKWYILRYKGTDLRDVDIPLRNLDVVILHELIIKRDLGITDVAYEMDIERSLKMVRKGDFDGVFFLNPTQIEDVENVALAGLRMPPKSTYFYPKLLTGLVINKFNN